MPRPAPGKFFRDSLKTDAYYADELINIFLLRPVAAVIVWALYPTRVTPNQVTVAAILFGFAAAGTFFVNTAPAFIAAGVLVTLKDIIDDVDGQLARAKQMYSRRGRFLDSIGDFLVDIALFAAITIVVVDAHPGPLFLCLGILSFFGITLRVSYHVYYQASFLHLEDRYKLNRIIEEVTGEDRSGDPVALRLQQVFNVIYTWQDKLIDRIDGLCKGKMFTKSEDRVWYADRAGLRISGFLGFGTELALLSICSMLNKLELYLWLNLICMNGICLLSVLYRRCVLAPRFR